MVFLGPLCGTDQAQDPNLFQWLALILLSFWQQEADAGQETWWGGWDFSSGLSL